MKIETTRRARDAHFRLPLAAGALALVALLAPAPGAALQEEGEDDQRVLPESILPGNDLQRELLEIVHRVERRLRAIDERLADAGAGAVALEEVEASGLDELLRDARSESRQVVDDIDRILEIARQIGGQQSGGSPMLVQPSEGESPLDQERDRGPMEREETPSEPRQEGQGDPSGEAEPQDEPQPLPNPPGGENRPGTPRDDEAGDVPARPDDADRWGELPVRYREVFRNQGGEDLPVQYRDWIDAYYRRLAEGRR